MIPPVRSIPLDYAAAPAPREVTGDWPEFSGTDDGARSVPAITFWLVFLGGAAVGFIGACAAAWAVLA